jgi:tripartite-type tricarboxylate transporter receptor subunit TctC
VFIRIVLVAMLNCIFLGFIEGAVPASAEDFYQGKVIRVVVGFTPGGGFDVYSRVIAKHIGSHIPGKPTVVVENMPGAGSLIAANFIYNRANPDGLTIGNFIGPLILQKVLGNKAANFEGTKFGWIGVPASDHTVCIFTKASGVTNMKQWASATKPPKIAAVASGSNTSDVPKILKEALNLPMQIIEGHKGTPEIALSMQAGETDGSCWSWMGMKAAMRTQLEGDDLQVVLQAAVNSHADLKKVPLAMDYAKTDLAKELIRVSSLMYNTALRPYALPPGTPADRIALSRRAFMETMKDPAFLAETKKAQLEIDPIDGAQTEKIISEVDKMKPATVAKLKELLLPPGDK